jgi:ribosomal protein S18 acetylase RimI-like enzyme
VYSDALIPRAPAIPDPAGSNSGDLAARPDGKSNGTGMGDIEIRRAAERDRPSVLRLAMLLQEAEHAMHPSRRSGASLAPVAVEELGRRTQGDAGAILLAEQDGAPIGYVAFYADRLESLELRPEAHRFLYVSDLCVEPGARGRGIAGRLLAEAEAACRRLGLPRLTIGVLAANEAARAAYRRAGYGPYELWLEKSIATAPASAPAGTGLALRPLAPADRATLLGFLRDLADEEAAQHWAMRPGSEMTMTEVDRTIEEIAEEDGAIVVAERDGRPVGYAGVVCQTAQGEFELRDEWQRRGFVTDMFVAPEARRRGIGLALLAACERHVASRGLDWLQICVSPGNAAANALYRRAGFRDYEIVLEKRL